MPLSLVLMAGWGMRAQVMQPLAQALKQQGPQSIHILCVDAHTSIPQQADIYLGWSLGALRLAQEVTCPLIVLGMGARFCDLGGVTQAQLRAFQRQFQRAPVSAWQSFLQWQAQGDTQVAYQHLLAHQQGDALAFPAASLAQGLEALAHLNISRAELQILGETDPLISTPDKNPQVQIAGAQQYQIPACGHLLPLTAVPQIAAYVWEFFQQNEYL
ncbi:hypothetical protein SAMN05421831_101347 [Allopseudospirillum japonicum]|uniref:Pimeloyl-[acyl-carrier protein] methyl ester esterase n=1 Tax=Allopseudospirillum japonicum TaxID=64971 RepID=A0A1H6QAZ9_9GAMM|nr:hypothetical protein [Allopseudospirillum japonicum]SEI40948.1 hypothetical protein SAMN05421831_101347 [Allopseudospirillum japonicum]